MVKGNFVMSCETKCKEDGQVWVGILLKRCQDGPYSTACRVLRIVIRQCRLI